MLEDRSTVLLLLMNLKITKNGCLKRDLFVLNLCKENKIPIACAMGGGYSPKIADIVDAHCNTFKAAINLFGSFLERITIA